jgi:hypothetical protein
MVLMTPLRMRGSNRGLSSLTTYRHHLLTFRRCFQVPCTSLCLYTTFSSLPEAFHTQSHLSIVNMADYCPVYAPFFGLAGVGAAMILSCK